jgi:predicted nucleotidyltransferase
MDDGGVAPRRRVTVEELHARQREIAAIAARYGVSNVRVFGSVARGEADEHSDLDLLIDVAPGHGYFDMAGFALEVEALLGVFTQVATENGLKARMRDRIIAEAVAV